MNVMPAALLGALLVGAGCQMTAEPPGPATTDPATTAEGPALAPAAFEPPGRGSIVMGHRADGTIEKTRVLATDGFAMTLERAGERITRLPFCHGCGDPRAQPVEMDRYEALWPLEVGKSVTFQRRRARDGAVWVHTVTVTGTETVATEIGPFRTYVVEERVEGAGGNRWSGRRTQWHAPELGWPVKAEWQGPDGDGSWEIARHGAGAVAR